MGDLLLFAAGLIVGAAVLIAVWAILRRASRAEPKTEIHVIAERVRAVGRLVGLEVSAKEIATATKGWSWLPPLLLSQARLAMIFQFEKQYAVDLHRLRESDVRELAPGRYRIELPAVSGVLRLTDVTPYDIQDGRVLGLLDVIQMNASTQRMLMERAQEQAGKLFETNDARYLAEARASLERQLTSLLAMFGIVVEIVWRQESTESDARSLQVEPGLLSAAGG